MKKVLYVCAAMAMAVALTSAAFADTLAYTDPAMQGTQTFGGNLALTFTVNSTSLTVDALGTFDATGTGVVPSGTSIAVGIYNSMGTLVASTVIGPGNYSTSGAGFDILQAIIPVVLTPGSYEVDAVGFGPSYMNGNLATGSSLGPSLNTFGGNVSYTGAAYDGNTSLNDPTTCMGCQSTPTPQNAQFDAGTFAVSTGTPIPEPASLSLLSTGVGLLGLGVFLRRKYSAAHPTAACGRDSGFSLLHVTFIGRPLHSTKAGLSFGRGKGKR